MSVAPSAVVLQPPPERFVWRGAFVAGGWRATGTDHVGVSPADTSREVVRWGHASDLVDEAVGAARQLAATWRDTPLAKRQAALRCFADRLEAATADLAGWIVHETGKPAQEAIAEVAVTVARLRSACDAAPEILQRHTPAGVSGYWEPVPLGVVAVLGPFNFPIHLSNAHIAAALVTGNVVLLKPSELAPACAHRYVEIWEDTARAAGVPAGVLSLLPGDAGTGAALATHVAVDAVALTGSYRAGVALRQATVAQTGKLLALEMGGKNALLLRPDGDLDAAIDAAVAGAFGAAGQKCTATSRLLVPRSMLDRVEARLAGRAAAWLPQDPWDPNARVGPLINEAALRRFVAAQADNAGLRTLAAGRQVASPTGRPGWWVSPAIHLVEHDEVARRRRTEELFGPELLVEGLDDDDDAVARIGAAPYGLVASVFTEDGAAFSWLRARLRCGVVHHNRGTTGSSGALPFGGFGHAGNHRPAGGWAMRLYVAPVATMVGP